MNEVIEVPEVNEYETPEVFELGRAEELTLGKRIGTCGDNFDGYLFCP